MKWHPVQRIRARLSAVGRKVGRAAAVVGARCLLPALAVLALGCIGTGLWMWVHPGAGVLAVGAVLWAEFKMMGLGAGRRQPR